MNFTKKLLLIQMFCVSSFAPVAQASVTPLLGPDLNSQNVYAGAAITLGAGSLVGGNLKAFAAATLGARSVVGVNLVAGAAGTLGAFGIVGNDLTAGAAITLGNGAFVGGNAKAGADITLGNGAKVVCNINAGADITLGADAEVGGNATAEGDVTYGSNSTVIGDYICRDTGVGGAVESKQEQLKTAQVALTSMPINFKLATTITENVTLQPGVYHAPGLSTTAGITVTLDGNNETNFWVFNINTYLSLGADTIIELLNVTPDSTIIWNTGGYTTIGAGSKLVGTVFAGTYFTSGSEATVTGIADSCGGIFTVSGAVTLGANNVMGSEGCFIGAADNFIIGDDGTADFFIEDVAGADAGPDQTVNENSIVKLDGSGSGLPNNNGTYSWVQLGPIRLTLNDSTAVMPTFTAPTVETGGETLTFELTFTDDNDISTKDVVNITAVNVNTAPVANAGDTQSIAAGSPVSLSGALSYDPDGDDLSYQWTQRAGDAAVELFNSDSVHPNFTPQSLGELVFDLTVNDGVASAQDSVTINVTADNNDPVADAGPDQTVNENILVILNGKGSSDPDSDTLTYEWTQLDPESAVTIIDSATSTPIFNSPDVNAGGDDFVFELTVNDGNGGISTDQVTVHVRHSSDIPNVSDIQLNQPCLWPPNHRLIPIVIFDKSDASTLITINSITQDEPTFGQGNGDTSPDAVFIDQEWSEESGYVITERNSSGYLREERSTAIYLRAERADTGDGRVYQINFTASNANGEVSGVLTVGVPSELIRDGETCNATDSGEIYDSNEARYIRYDVDY